MCGRFTLATPDIKQLILRFSVKNKPVFEYRPRYNIAPSQQVVAIVNDGQKNILGQLRWGLVPHWARDEKIGYKMINARMETLNEKPSFRSLYARRRCLIIGDGFYEWKQQGKIKQPHYFRLSSGEPFAFAGLWDKWDGPNGPISSCTIITTEANDTVKPIHPRMPVILEPAAESLWLDKDITDSVLLDQVLKPYPERLMQHYPVSKMVNSPHNESPECIQPISTV